MGGNTIKKIDPLKLLILVIIFLTIIIGIIIVSFSSSKDKNHTDSYEEIDPISGSIIQFIDQEPEVPSSNVVFIGFNILNEMGFSLNDKDKIRTDIENYFRNKYKETIILHYKKDSFNYESNEDSSSNFYKSHLIFVYNNKEYLVKIDKTTANTIVTISE